jgi:type IV pilus biogenesis protein CpaD/CtpE
MAIVYNYPAEEDIKVIRCCVSLFLKSRNGKARDMMARSIRHILNQYGITRLQLENFSVRATGEKFAVVEAVE